MTTNDSFERMSDAMTNTYEAFQKCGVSFDDFTSIHSTLGTSPAAMRDALEILSRPPRYPLWRFAVDIILMAVLALCIIVVYVNPFAWQYQSTTIALCSVLLFWIDSIGREWERRHRIH